MQNKKINIRFGILSMLIFLAALSRLLPHPPNFTPVGAMALFGAAYFNRKVFAFLVPLIAMWISDLILNNVVYAKLYPEFYGNGFVWFGNLWVYASFAAIILLGSILLKRVKLMPLLGTSIAASLLFFLVTNFGHWTIDPLYTKNFSGLMTCYIAAIPYFWNTLLGDLFYVGLLFGVFELIQYRFPVLQFSK